MTDFIQVLFTNPCGRNNIGPPLDYDFANGALKFYGMTGLATDYGRANVPALSRGDNAESKTETED